MSRFLDDQPRRPTPVLKALATPETVPSAPDRAALDAHLARAQYGRFALTEAVRPGWQLEIVPQAGYRHDSYLDPATGSRLPALVAAVSAERLFETFVDLLEPLGETVDMVLESTHQSRQTRLEYRREGVERLVLESVLWEFEDLLLHDGCTAIAVMHPDLPLEVQFDEHKLLVIYVQTRPPFERILRDAGLVRDDRIRFISQGEHIHASSDRQARRFDELSRRLGAVSPD